MFKAKDKKPSVGSPFNLGATIGDFPSAPMEECGASMMQS